jgi:hypothetical protein
MTHPTEIQSVNKGADNSQQSKAMEPTGKLADPTPGRSAVAVCCLNAAQMLHMADDDQDHPPEKRRTFQKYNRGQASLLIEAAKQADEMLAAARAVLKFYDAVDRPYDDGEAEILDALADAMAKATGRQP